MGEDQEKLEIAEENVRKLIECEDPDVPTESIPPYGHKGGGLRFPTEIVSYWYQFFNPRQLLTLVKFVKLIREAGKLIEKEKIEEGLTREEAFKYAEGVVTYLTIWLADFVDYNSTFNRWNPPFWGLLKVQESLSFRGIGMVWNWCEFHAVIGLEIFIKYILKGLNYLTSVHEFRAITQKHCVLDDATILSKINEKFDLIVTDPPYYDDVAYSELSDFYYVWLKRALSDVKGNTSWRRCYAKGW